MVPVEAVISLEEVNSTSSISRYNQSRSVCIIGENNLGVATGEAMKVLEERAQEILPAGLSYEWSGSSLQALESSQQTVFIVALSLLFVYFFLVALYNSWSIPVVILLVAPISIVGALILGDTAVKAGLVSPPGVMVVAISAITIYSVPDESEIVSVLRLVFTFLGGILGLQGVLCGLIVLLSYLCNDTSFDVPYVAPYAPFILNDQKDFLFKSNIVNLDPRPLGLNPKNKRRKGYEKDN
jgi:hypothetical protein